MEIHPDDPDARASLGSTFKARGKYEAALRAYRKVTRLVPKHFTAWMNIGMTLMDLRRDSEARTAFDMAYQISSTKFDDVIATTRKQLRGVS